MSRTAYLNATPMQRELVRHHLCGILAILRAQRLSYQTSHWQVSGDDYYGNHLLFMRFYDEDSPLDAQIDVLAEKIVGYFGPAAVDLGGQIEKISFWVHRWSKISCHHRRGLASEKDLQEALKKAYDGIKEAGAMTLGLDDWIMAAANQHEEHEYLLQQALNRSPGEKQASRPGPQWNPWSSPAQGRAFQAVLDLYESYIKNPDMFYKLYDQDASFLREVGQLRRALVREDRQAAERAARKLDKMEPGFIENPVWAFVLDGQKMAASPVAPSAEADFYDNPEKREVREFAESGALTNIPPVAAEAASDEMLDLSPAKEVAQAKRAPPTPEEIAEAPGAEAVSTLNRFVVDTEDPEAEGAVSMNEPLLESKKLMASWLREVESSQGD
jgi:DNA-binding ferritin-like protein